MPTKRQKRKRRSRDRGARAPGRPSEPAPGGQAAEAKADDLAGARAPDGPPPPPWGSFPLSELVVLVALALLVAGFFTGPPRGGVMLGAGLVLGSLAGLELSVREHFAGYRSHTLLLAGAVGIAILIGLVALAKTGPLIAMGAAALAAGASAWALAAAFRSRSGELYRITPGGR